MPALRAAKAAPILRPSRNYEAKIKQRDYDREKEERAEARRIEAEARRLAREGGVSAESGTTKLSPRSWVALNLQGGGRGGNTSGGKSEKDSEDSWLTSPGSSTWEWAGTPWSDASWHSTWEASSWEDASARQGDSVQAAVHDDSAAESHREVREAWPATSSANAAEVHEAWSASANAGDASSPRLPRSQASETGSAKGGEVEVSIRSRPARLPSASKGVHCEVLKHSGMGCAIVSLESHAVREHLLDHVGKQSAGGRAVTTINTTSVELQRHKDRATGRDVSTDLFVAWGSREEKRAPLRADSIAGAFDQLVGGLPGAEAEADDPQRRKLKSYLWQMAARDEVDTGKRVLRVAAQLGEVGHANVEAIILEYEQSVPPQDDGASDVALDCDEHFKSYLAFMAEKDKLATGISVLRAAARAGEVSSARAEATIQAFYADRAALAQRP
eukprot:CAMPEP_0117503192 /NCGR_PEP_ID=MMETSP0784-20121206/24202_1 /TAXON_ID=39447 /ORGANISM="" /LENGTH=445 /DNA_ID=CAMNT_0005298499 /DNA_START=15 /DNA_END=1349 /DNA_ORIENTATION=+